jgi:hypothetical protein
MTPTHTSLPMVSSIVFPLSRLISCILLGLDPAIKMDYLNAAWDQEFIDKGMEQFKAQVSV